MENRLKFRFWSKLTNEMCDRLNPNHVLSDTIHELLVPMQFTGFKDNKGNDIYEGDILSDWTETDEGMKQSSLQVYWCDSVGGWKLDYSFNQDKSIGDLLSEELSDFAYEITGNIWEGKKN
jgi:hypothetical protein